MSTLPFSLCDKTNAVIRSVNSSGIISAPAITGERFGSPEGIAFDGNGNLYVCDTESSHVYKVSPSFAATAIATTGTNNPAFVACDPAGNVYVSVPNSDCVMAVNTQATTQTLLGTSITSGSIAVVAGTLGSGGYSGDGAAATSAELHDPQGVAVDSSGNLFIADTTNRRIRRVDHATGIITTVAGNGTEVHPPPIDGGSATDVSLGAVNNVIAVDSQGNLYIGSSDVNSYSAVLAVNMQATTQTILTVSIDSGCIQVVAGLLGDGSEYYGYNGDGIAAISATLSAFWSLMLDSSGNLYIADTTNYRIRQVNATTGVITTIAGNGTDGNTGNGSAATSAEIGQVFGLATLPPAPPTVQAIIAETQVDAYPDPNVNQNFIRFRFRSTSPLVPQVNGNTVTITATTSDGPISQTLWPNSAVVAPGSWYTVEFWCSGRIVSSANYIITTSGDLSSMTQVAGVNA